MDVESYLNRINYKGDLTPNMEVLKKLQRAHLLHIPFENLDIHMGVPIRLDLNRIFQKVILNKRGGFCYELNGLFNALLIQLGFQTKRISSRVYSEGVYGPEYDHLVSTVFLADKEYIADVGFGEFTMGPLEICLNLIQEDERGRFIIEAIEDDYLRVSKISEAGNIPEYKFKNIHREYDEYQSMCSFHQTDPTSHFMKKKFITRPLEEGGRITLSQNNLKISYKDKIDEIAILNEQDFTNKLLRYFNISLSQPQ